MNEFVTVDNREYPVGEKKRALKHVKLTIGKDCITGRQIQHDYTGKTIQELQEKIDASRHLSNEQLQLLPEEITLEELGELYLKAKSLILPEQTIKTYRGWLRNRILPYFGNTTVRKIQSYEIDTWLRQLEKNGKRAPYRKNTLLFLSQTMEYGCRKGYLHVNPCRYIQEQNGFQRDQTILTQKQIEHLLIDEKDHPFASFYAITLLLGLRISEAIGLSWKQINWEKRTVCINQQATRDRKIVPYTKNRRARTIQIPMSAEQYLRRELEKQQLNPAFYKKCNPYGLVFTNNQGKMLRDRVVSNAFQKIMADTDGPHVTVHSLRRTAASILAETVSLHAAQYYLGHTTMSTTLRYVYPSAKDIQHLVEITGAYYEKLLEKVNTPLEEGGENH